MREFSTRVREVGHGIALDHFGSSFSNFGYLQSMRPDYVKIDRAFTNELGKEDSDSDFFISSLCSVAHSLDVEVMAEGVENAEQFELLKELDVDGVQGYYIDKPGPLDA
jgi:EAL domain-containing protein (putative c-di-GMP-specific phosphodiesterase class I)